MDLVIYRPGNNILCTKSFILNISDRSKRELRNTRSDLEIPLRKYAMAKNAFHIKARQCGTVSA